MLEMSPAAGTQVQKDATVNLVVAKEPKQVAVPDVVDDGTTSSTTRSTRSSRRASGCARRSKKADHAGRGQLRDLGRTRRAARSATRARA